MFIQTHLPECIELLFHFFVPYLEKHRFLRIQILHRERSTIMYHRVRSLEQINIIALLYLAVFQFFPDVLMSVFNSEGDVMSQTFMELGISALRIVSLHFPLAAIGIALGASFPALGNGIYSTITSLCRQLLVLVPAAYLLSLSGNVNAVWWSFPIAEVASLLVTLILYGRIYRKQIKPLFTV